MRQSRKGGVRAVAITSKRLSISDATLLNWQQKEFEAMTY